MRTVVLRVVALALLLLLALFSVLSIRTMRRLPDTLLYFVQSTNTGFTLAPVGRVNRADTEEARVRAALVALIDGPNDSERAKGLSTAFPPDTEVVGVTLESGTATINLSNSFASGGGLAAQQGRLYQLLYTVSQSKHVDKVYLRLNGDPVRVFGSEGISLEQPWQRAEGLPSW